MSAEILICSLAPAWEQKNQHSPSLYETTCLSLHAVQAFEYVLTLLSELRPQTGR